MAWTQPRTWTAGAAELTAANLNTHLRDQLSFLAALPRCRVYNSANISVPNNTWTSLTYNTERVDTDTIHSTASNTSRLTAVTAGWYRIFGGAEFASNATGKRGLRIHLTAARESSTFSGELVKELLPPVNGDSTGLSIATHAYMAVGDYVELQAFQDSGGALNALASGNYSPEFGMRLKTGF